MTFPKTGYSGYSPVKLANELLETAEKFYGKRLKLIKISVEHWKSDHPEATFDALFTHATIHVYQSDPNGYRFQLAHEIIHCLSSGVPSSEDTYLEEGLALVFALRMSQGMQPPNDIDYAAARATVEALESLCPDAVSKLRESKEPRLSKITAQQIVDVCPKVPRALADFLCTHFKSPPRV
jgi:hypothetical protein